MNIGYTRLFNLLGVVWAILGGCLLSHLIKAPSRFKKLFMRLMNYLTILVLFSTPLGLLLGAIVAQYSDLPH